MNGLRRLALALCFAAGGAEAQVFRDGAAADIGIVYPPPGIILSGGDLVWAATVPSPVSQGSSGPPQIRLRFSDIVVSHGVEDIRIEIADTSGRVYDTLTREMLAAGGPIWTLMVPGIRASVRVRGADAASGLGFRIDRVAYSLESRALESIFGENELVDVVKYDGEHADVVRSVESSVARIQFIVGSASDTCSGFRIAADLVQTSSHCIPDATTCASASIMFGFEKNAFNSPMMGQQVRCIELAAVEGPAGPDTAILRVAPIPKDEYAVVRLTADEATKGQPLFIVQHPGGEPKKLSIAGCARMDTAETLAEPDAFGHSCDTKGGSSGAPVFNLEGLVVGQQRAGHRNPDIFDQPSLATPAAELAILMPPVPVPGGLAADPDSPANAPIGTARPLPLPIAPADVKRGTAPAPDTGPGVVGAGSTGDGTVAPEE